MLAYSTWRQRDEIIRDAPHFDFNVPPEKQTAEYIKNMEFLNTDTPQRQSERLAKRQPFGPVLFSASALIIAASATLGVFAINLRKK